MHVSHETIYRSLFVQSRGVLKQSLVRHLRRRRSMRRAKGTARRGQGRGEIVDAISIRERPPLPKGLMASLTVDRGPEFAAHQAFTLATDVQVYFCDPRSPWQRGSNEITNGLLRQYFPKGQDLSHVPQATLNAVARRLNERPRKTLGWQTPAAKLAEVVASTR